MKKFIVLIGFLSLVGSAVGMTEDMSLTEAVRQGKSDFFIRSLIERGADVGTELGEAARKGDLDFVKALVIAGADVNEKSEHLERTPLMWAAWEGKLPVVQELILAGADKDAKDEHGRTALVIAAQANQPNVVRELSSRGADVDITDKFGNKALDYGWDKEEIYKDLYPKTTGAWKRTYSQKRYTGPALALATGAAAYLGYEKGRGSLAS